MSCLIKARGQWSQVVCQNFFLKVSVSLSGFGPSVAHGKLSVRGRCVQATKNKAETCSLLDAIGRRSCGRSGLGIKVDVWEHLVVYASTRDWSSLYGTMSALWNCRSVFLLALRESLGTLRLSLFCLYCSLCSEFYCDASGEFCFTSLWVLSLSA